MKTFRFSLLLAVLVSLFSACKNDAEVVLDEYGQPEDNKTYTIMMYGCGGKNLDERMMQNLDEAFFNGATDRVNFTAQVNFSQEYQVMPEFKNTQRYIVPKTPDTEPNPVFVYDELLRLYEPENLTDFINWSKEQCPADEYILILWNHGGGWSPEHDDPDGYEESLKNQGVEDNEETNTRAICYDDNFNNEALTLADLVQGINDSGIKFKMIYFDACLMGAMEVITGVKDCADYFMGASHITPGIGGDYNALIHHLDTRTNFESSMKEYCHETMAHWNLEDSPFDLKMINLNKLDLYLNEVKVFAGYLNECAEISCQYISDLGNGTYDPGTERETKRVAEMLDYAVNGCYSFSNPTDPVRFFDLNYLAEYCTAYPKYHAYSSKFVDISSRMNRTWNEIVVCSETSRVARQLDLSVGVTIVNGDEWIKKGYDKTYDKLAFHKITGWGDWLSDNPHTPQRNPNPSMFEQGNVQPEGGNPEGGNPEGETPEGGNPEGETPEGENPEGNDAEGEVN